MFGSGIIDVAIGLVLVYLVLSMMASAANELYSNVAQSRAKNLEQFIRHLFISPQEAKKTDTLFGFIRRHLPNKMTEAEKVAEGSCDYFYEKTLIAPHTNGHHRPAYINPSDFAQAIMDMVYPERQEKATFEEWQKAIHLLPDSFPVKQVLTSTLNNTRDDLSKLQVHLETWFNSSMERVSEWYKRQTQVQLIMIGLLVALVLNVDTISIANRLLQNPALRDAISKQAASLAQQTPAGSTLPADQSLGTLKQQLDQLNVPLGWPDQNPPDVYKLAPLNVLAWWVQKLIGIAVTAFAVSQGAPFWFDLLNRFSNVRSTGKPPETSDTPPPG